MDRRCMSNLCKENIIPHHMMWDSADHEQTCSWSAVLLMLITCCIPYILSCSRMVTPVYYVLFRDDNLSTIALSVHVYLPVYLCLLILYMWLVVSGHLISTIRGSILCVCMHVCCLMCMYVVDGSSAASKLWLFWYSSPLAGIILLLLLHRNFIYTVPYLYCDGFLI